MVKLRFLGHAAFEVRSENTTLLIDPFISGNPAAAVKLEDLAAVDYIWSPTAMATTGDAVPIAKRTGATVVANHELCNYRGAWASPATRCTSAAPSLFPSAG